MKIAILADPLDNQSTGVHTYTKQLISALAKYDTENDYLIIRERKDPNLPFEQIAIPNIHLPVGFASFRLFFIIPLILRFKKIDAVMEPAHFGPFNLPKRIKRITMIHDMTPLIMPQYHRFNSQLLQRIFLKKILKKADLILSNSKNTSKDIIKLFPFTKPKLSTILLGRDLDFQPTISRTYLDKEGIECPYFMYTGTIEPRKNLIVLLEAFRLFREHSESKVLLLIVGKKGWKSKDFYDALANHPFLNDIFLTGYVEKHELIELYSHAMALVYPSLYEGFGLPILEALSCGTQVICSNNSSLPEVGGEATMYFDAENESQLCLQMVQVFQNASNGTDKTVSFLSQANKFSWKGYVKSFMKVLHSFLAINLVLMSI